MTTQHNSTVPHRKNPLQVRLTARISSLHHSKTLVTSLDFSTRRRSQPSHKFVFFPICNLYSFAHGSVVLQYHQTGYDGNPVWDAVFNSTFKLPPVDLVFLTAILVRYACTQDGTPACFPRLHSFVARFLAVAWLRNQMSRVPFVHGTIPHPSAFTVRLSHGLEMQLRVRQQAVDKLSFGSVRRTEAIVAKRRSIRFTCSTSKGPGVRHTIHRQEIMLQCTTYCNKEHSHQNTCSLYTGGNLADTGSLELPPWNPPAS